MIEKLADKMYKITHLDYPNFSSLFIGPNGDCLLSVGVMKQFKFNIKDLKIHEYRVSAAVGKELFSKIQIIAGEYTCK